VTVIGDSLFGGGRPDRLPGCDERTIAKTVARPMTKSVALQHVKDNIRAIRSMSPMAHPVRTADPAERAERMRVIPIDVTAGPSAHMPAFTASASLLVTKFAAGIAR
jgi:hypothetical protein